MSTAVHVPVHASGMNREAYGHVRQNNWRVVRGGGMVIAAAVFVVVAFLPVWRQGIDSVWSHAYLNVLANFLIGGAYLGIAAILLRLSRKTGLRIPFLPVLSAAGIFIVGCTAVYLFASDIDGREMSRLLLAVRYMVVLTSLGAAAAVPSLIPRLQTLVRGAKETITAHDVIERQNADLRRANAEANENLERLRSLIHSLPLGAIAIDHEQNVIHANDRFCQLFSMRVPCESLIGTSYAKVSAMKRNVVADEDHLWRLDSSVMSGSEALSQLVHLHDGRVVSRDAVPITVQGLYRGHLLLYRDATR